MTPPLFRFGSDVSAAGLAADIGRMKCRVCSAPCISVLVERCADGGKFRIWAGYCARHSEDMKRPLTTEVET